MTEPESAGLSIGSVIDNLVSTNELGDGRANYREQDGVAFVDVYDDDRVGEDGVPIPTATYRLGVTLTKVAASDDAGAAQEMDADTEVSPEAIRQAVTAKLVALLNRIAAYRREYGPDTHVPPGMDLIQFQAATIRSAAAMLAGDQNAAAGMLPGWRWDDFAEALAALPEVETEWAVQSKTFLDGEWDVLDDGSRWGDSNTYTKDEAIAKTRHPAYQRTVSRQTSATEWAPLL